jgi:hypothetical protein
MPPPLIEVANEEFRRRPLEALTFYNQLHADGVRPMPPVSPASVAELLATPVATWDEFELDRLANHLLHGGKAVPDADTVGIADAVSLRYASLLAGAKRDRSVRMKLQYVNFLLREKIDRDRTVQAPSQVLGDSPPWDWLPLLDGELVIFSGTENLHWRRPSGTARHSVGLPSQLDPLPGGRVSIGSIFSNGGAIWDDGRIELLTHDVPVVLQVELPNGAFIVDYRGHVYRRGTRERVAQFPAGEISKARLVGDTIYAFDWSAPHVLLALHTGPWNVERHILPDVLLGNDLCPRPGGGYYVIDKQQGYLFSFDPSFRLQEKALGFGRSDGRLFDPISLRLHAGRVHVVNWVSRTMVSLAAA